MTTEIAEMKIDWLQGIHPETDFDWTWLQQMFARRALRDNKVVYDFNSRGRLNKVTVEEYVKAFEPLAGRIVSENIQGEMDTEQYENSPHPADPDDEEEDTTWKRVRIVWEDGCMSLYASADSAELHIYSLDKARVEKATEIFSKVATQAIASNGKAYVMVQTQQGIEFESIGVASVKFEQGNYNEEVVEGYNHVVKDLKTEKPCGRICVFDGPPGTGKTYLVRALLSDVKDALFVLVSPDLVPQLASPHMVQAILQHRHGRKGPTVFVVEDADTVLAKRGADNMSSVGAVLNLSDGLLGNMLDIRVVATTNAERKEIDEAVMRDGRLCRRIEVSSLTYERACVALKRIGGNPADLDKGKEYSVAQLYRLARGDRTEGAAKEIKKPKGVMGFGA